MFIHNYKSPGTIGFNSFIGIEAGNFTMSGSWNQASYNTGVRYQSLSSFTIGIRNSAFGSWSLFFNTTGNQNTAIGYNAGGNITIGSNNITIIYNAQGPTNTASNQIRLGNTSITYAGIQVTWGDIPKAEILRVTVFDILGKDVTKLVNQGLEPGEYVVNFDASALSSGTYFYRINAGVFTDVKKMTVVK